MRSKNEGGNKSAKEDGLKMAKLGKKMEEENEFKQRKQQNNVGNWK
jgi:hypothetical protein